MPDPEKKITPLEEKRLEELKDKRSAGFMKVGYSWLSKLFESCTEKIVEVLSKDIYKIHIANLPKPQEKADLGKIEGSLEKIAEKKEKDIKVENFPIYLSVPKDLKVEHDIDYQLDFTEVADLLKSIRDKEIKPTDLSKLEKVMNMILSAIRSQKLKINVDAPDLSEIAKVITGAIEGLEKKIIKQVLPVQNGLVQVQLPEKQVRFLVTEMAKQVRGPSGVRFAGVAGPSAAEAAPVVNYKDFDDLSSQVDGTNKVFNLSLTPKPGASLMLVYNGDVIKLSATNYSLSGKVVTTVFTPEVDSELWAAYRY